MVVDGVAAGPFVSLDDGTPKLNCVLGLPNWKLFFVPSSFGFVLLAVAYLGSSQHAHLSIAFEFWTMQLLQSHLVACSATIFFRISFVGAAAVVDAGTFAGGALPNVN